MEVLEIILVIVLAALIVVILKRFADDDGDGHVKLMDDPPQHRVLSGELQEEERNEMETKKLVNKFVKYKQSSYICINKNS